MAERPKNYSTTIAAKRTAQECLTLLADAGADHVAVSYTDKQPVALAFVLDTVHGTRSFKLPVNIDGVHKLLRSAEYARPGQRTQFTSREHAADVAWRVIRDWLDAQVALIAAEMATIDEVMLPYLQVTGGQTLIERYRENEQLAIEAGR